MYIEYFLIYLFLFFCGVPNLASAKCASTMTCAFNLIIYTSPVFFFFFCQKNRRFQSLLGDHENIKRQNTKSLLAKRGGLTGLYTVTPIAFCRVVLTFLLVYLSTNYPTGVLCTLCMLIIV